MTIIEPSTPMQRGRPLLSFLTMLMLSFLVPVLVLTGSLIWRFAKLDLERANQQALQLARSVTGQIDRDIDGSIETLIALSKSNLLQQGNFEGFYRQAKETMDFRKLNVLLQSTNGQQLLNTRLPWGSLLPRQELSSIDQQVVASRQPMASDLVIGAVAKRWVLGLSVPVLEGNSVRYLLTMSIDPEFIEQLIVGVPRDPKWIIAISDRTGRLIARTEEHAALLGREITNDVRRWSSGPEGVRRTLTLVGQDVVRGYRWSDKTGWLTAAFVPAEVIDAPIRNLWRLFGALALLLTATSVPLVIWFARQITEPIAAATASAAKLGQGKAIVASASPLLEANVLTESLAAAARELADRTHALAANEIRYRSVFEQAAVGFKQVGLDGKLLGINERLCKMLGYTRDECLAKTFEIPTYPDDRHLEDGLIVEIVKGDRPHYEVEKRMVTKSGDIIWVRVTSAVVRDGEGKTIYRTAVVEDVTERRKAREAAARLASIVEATPDAMFSICPNGTIETWNPGAEKLFGYTAEEMIGKSYALLARPGHPEDTEGNIAAIMRGETLNIETVRRHKDGSLIDVSMAAAPIKTGGKITSISVTMEDIRDRKKRERQIMLLNRELAHRVKNSLAVIQSISNQTMRSCPDPETFRIAFQGRLQALASAHDLLTQSSWDGADVNDFVDTQLAALVPRNSIQLQKDGPPGVIPAELSIPLGLALHELGTNAIKYGAWSAPDGRVHLKWEFKAATSTQKSDEESDHARRLIMTWTEHGGPIVQKPTRRGFGTLLIERGVPGAIVVHQYLSSGVVCKIDMPLPEPVPLDIE